MSHEPHPPHSPSFWDRTVGVFLIFLGIAGVLLPVMPGVPFLIVGLVKIFGPDHWITRPVLGKLKQAADQVREWNQRRKGDASKSGPSGQGSPES